ncbi:DUF6204 family protein [Streptomyces sp. NPDC058701]|uniref:DUF6204 family protein n=1 Tax=Streptomyces sp. NPDC058701 TaxID=3346608 RepID=UPI00364BC3F5
MRIVRQSKTGPGPGLSGRAGRLAGARRGPRREAVGPGAAFGRALATACDDAMPYAAFTPEGHLVYDIAAATPSRSASWTPARPRRTSSTRRTATDRDGPRRLAAESRLGERGYGFEGLAPRAQDMSLAPLSRRQRRAAARADGGA